MAVGIVMAVISITVVLVLLTRMESKNKEMVRADLAGERDFLELWSVVPARDQPGPSAVGGRATVEREPSDYLCFQYFRTTASTC